LLERSLGEYFAKIKRNNIQFNVIGRINELPSALGDRLKKAMKETSANSGMVLNLALNYGGRQEIVDAVKAVFKKSKEEGLDVASLDEETLGKFLYTGDLRDPDMIIRTGGEMRLSNFLLWQAAYSEIYVTDVLWPDFNREELEKALDEYAKRARNFGK
jgi:undecaprenyl diphosphate synthase